MNIKARENLQANLHVIEGLLDIQGQNGTWDYDTYMLGLFNGLEMARAVITETDPQFRKAPPQFLVEKARELSGRPIESETAAGT